MMIYPRMVNQEPVWDYFLNLRWASTTNKPMMNPDTTFYVGSTTPEVRDQSIQG
jgi:hypothetical protein